MQHEFTLSGKANEKDLPDILMLLRKRTQITKKAFYPATFNSPSHFKKVMK